MEFERFNFQLDMIFFWDVLIVIGLRYQVSWFSICLHTLLMTWALDSISEESGMPKAECFPLEEGVVWYSTGEVFRGALCLYHDR